MRFSIFIFLIFAVTLLGQSCSEQVIPKSSADVDQLIEGKRFLFVAHTAYPSRGGSRFLNGNSDLAIKNDTIISFLPYFGVSSSAPMTSDEAGIKFTTYRAEYSAQKKKGSWEINLNLTDQPNTNRMLLIVSPNGSASLDVRSKFRDAITFQGNIRGIR
jgi:hypothetical protein